MHDTIRPLLVALLLPTALAAQTESGAFVVRLGKDTLALEQYSRSADRLEGQLVIRSPRTQHRIYRATLGPDGAVQRFELITHNLSGAGPAEQRATLEFQGDSAIARVPRGDSTVTQRFAVAPGTAPFLIHHYGLVEYLAWRAVMAGGERYTGWAVQLGATSALPVTAQRAGADSLVLSVGPLGPFRMKVSPTGRLEGLSGVGSTVQVMVERLASLDIGPYGPAFANRPLGTLSPLDSVQAAIGGAAVAVKYSRPSMRGRTIFGQVVPWNQVWRTGANAATLFETSADLVMGGSTVPAGKYTLWTIPSPAGWKLIVNKNTGQWGTEYDAAHDLLRLDMTVETVAQPVEQFTISIEPRGQGAVLAIAWETTRASIAVAKK